jgi:hypothetical protein
MNGVLYTASLDVVQEVANLSGQIELASNKPVFNGQYSSVYHGKLGDELVRNVVSAPS